MKKVSKTLNGWADIFIAAAVIEFIVGIIGFFIDSAWSGNMIFVGILLLILAPVLRGLSILVLNAEEQIDDRFNEKLNNEE